MKKKQKNSNTNEILHFQGNLKQNYVANQLAFSLASLIQRDENHPSKLTSRRNGKTKNVNIS